jgi:hypothetical protein
METLTSATAGSLGAPWVGAEMGTSGIGTVETGGCGAMVEMGSGAGRPTPADIWSMRALILSSNRANRLDSEGGVTAAVRVPAVVDDASSRFVCVGKIRECRTCNSKSAGAFRRKSDDFRERERWSVEARRRGLEHCSRRSLGWVADCLHG